MGRARFPASAQRHYRRNGGVTLVQASTADRQLAVDEIIQAAADRAEVIGHGHGVEPIKVFLQRDSVLGFAAAPCAALPATPRTVRDRGAMQLVRVKLRAGDNAPSSTGSEWPFRINRINVFEGGNAAGWGAIAAKAWAGLQSVAALAFARK